MPSSNRSPTWRPCFAVLALSGLLALLFWLRPKLGGGEFLLGVLLIAALVTVLPVCLLILLGRPPHPGTSSMRERLPILSIAAIGLPTVVGLFWASRQGFDHVAVDVFMIALFVILLVDIPLGVLMLVGYPVTISLSPLIPSREERAKRWEMQKRASLSDDEFIDRFYSETSVPPDIPLRLRKLYSEQLGMDKVRPDDVATEFDWELDIRDLIVEVQDLFGVDFTMEEIHQLDGSFDSIVRAVAANRVERTSSQEPDGNQV